MGGEFKLQFHRGLVMSRLSLLIVYLFLFHLFKFFLYLLLLFLYVLVYGAIIFPFFHVLINHSFFIRNINHFLVKFFALLRVCCWQLRQFMLQFVGFLIVEINEQNLLQVPVSLLIFPKFNENCRPSIQCFEVIRIHPDNLVNFNECLFVSFELEEANALV